MQTRGGLNEYLISVDERARDMFSRLVKEYADRQGREFGKVKSRKSVFMGSKSE